MKLNNVIKPNSIGWLDYKLSEKEMDYIWRCIGNKNQNTQCIGDSYDLMDRGDWFFTNCLRPVIDTYSNEFTNLGAGVGIPPIHPYKLTSWWVSYQKKNEFFSYHHHSGIYSFVIWMKIPYSYRDQNIISKLADKVSGVSPKNSNTRSGCFEFNYPDILGNTTRSEYKLDKNWEGNMVFFPSRLPHAVYPFYNSDEDRISVAGNITFDTSKIL
tara:strand:+ start:73 stop:711 length:639 start_codon:yes stop_codon:yes gene_type:complete